MSLQDYYITGDDSSHGVGGAVWRCQTFTAGENYDIQSVKLLIYRTSGYFPGTFTVSIYDTDDDDKPIDDALCSGTINGNGLATDSAGEWTEIIFGTSYSLVSGTIYAIVIKADANEVRWRVDTIPPVYENGIYGWSFNSGASWSTYDLYSAMFETYGVPAWPAGTIAGVSGKFVVLSLETTGIKASIAGIGGESGVLTFETIGMIAGIAGVSGHSADLIYEQPMFIGTIAVVAALSADIMFVEIIKPSTSVTMKRLVAAGNNQIWYEDI